jgi:predicted HNH restriction endonuclease
MAEKQYKITTSKKVFETDNVGPDYLKEDNGVFYAKEIKTDNWQQIKKIEKRTSALEKYNAWSVFLGVIVYIGFPITLSLIISEFELEKEILGKILSWGWFLWLFWLGPGTMNFADAVISKTLKQHPSYYELISSKEIRKLLERNKWHFTSTQSSYKNYSSKSNYSGGGYSSGGSGGARSGSYSGGSSGSYSGYSKNYISSSDLDKALKDIESKGKDWNKLANSTTDEEREKLFAEYFKDKEKGEAANEKFNREQIWPARKRTLNKMLEEAEYEDDETKENLKEKINDFNDEISNDEFQTVAKEIKKFQERKKLKDNHIKYEGRLNNKDIQSIKEYHGYICMGCGLDPVKEYGNEMKGILEAHHKKPWSEIEANEVRTVEPDDFYILCPTCHRVIHRLEHPDDLEGLKEVVNKKKSSWWN